MPKVWTLRQPRDQQARAGLAPVEEGEAQQPRARGRRDGDLEPEGPPALEAL